MFLCFLQVRLFNERQKHFALTSSVAILKIGIIKQLCRDKSCQFRPPKKAKKKFLCSNFRRPKVCTVQREVGCWCDPKLASCTRKKSYSFTPAGECLQSVQSLEERLEDLHQSKEHLFKCRIPSLSDFQTQVIVYPNTYFCIYKIFIWA